VEKLSEPVASVVMPARDAAATIAVQLAALADQPDSARLEVIVVDNGSSDYTSGVARAWGDRLPRLRVLVAAKRPNAGYARNVGVAAAQCEIILLCDADDRVERGWSRALLHELEDADSVGGLTVGWDGTATSLGAPDDAGSVPEREAGSVPEREAGLVVVDYKTDAWATDADLDVKLARYRLQGASYALALAQATGESVARCVFLFLAPSGAVARDVVDLPAAIEEVRALLREPTSAVG
jgi:glycosyltransferase involved in cell wall biosynthesis